MKTKLKTLAAGGLTLILILGLTNITLAQGRRGGRHGFLRQRFLQTQLTEEQREEIKNLVQSMRDQDADRKAIHDAVQEKLREWGIEFPRRGQGHQGMGKRQERGKSSLRASNRPNPFNPETVINYTLENPEYVTIKIYNIQGQLIRTLADTQKSAGTHHVRWDGRHDNGEVASAGIYVYRIEAGKQHLTGRMTLAK